MKRLYYVIAMGLSLTACVADPADEPTTSEAEQQASSSWYGYNHFPNAKMTPTPWDGVQVLVPTLKQGYVITRISNDYLVVLGDVGTGQVLWARTVTPQQIGSFYASAAVYGQIFTGRHPPGPIPTGDQNIMARYSMEKLQLSLIVEPTAFTAVTGP